MNPKSLSQPPSPPKPSSSNLIKEILLSKLSKKSNHKRSLILEALQSAGPGLAIGGGAAALGGAVGAQRQKEHAHKMVMKENELSATLFMTEIDDDDIFRLSKSQHQLQYITERLDNLIKTTLQSLETKINNSYVSDNVLAR